MSLQPLTTKLPIAQVQYLLHAAADVLKVIKPRSTGRSDEADVSGRLSPVSSDTTALFNGHDSSAPVWYTAPKPTDPSLLPAAAPVPPPGAAAEPAPVVTSKDL
jgi:hypothetical protein